MTNTYKIQRYGWRPSRPDSRDLKYGDVRMLSESLPSQVDLRPHCPAVYDQGDIGSCTANALAGLFQFVLRKEGKKDFTPSRLFIYYNERRIEGTVTEDSGAELRDGMKVLHWHGAPHEDLWWYNTAKFAVKPNRGVYADGLHHTASQYLNLDNTNLNQMKSCLANGYPFVLGFMVYESFESEEVAVTGIMPMPSVHDTVIGGHAVLCVGYDDASQMFIIRNSWGTSWGLNGYFMMPYAYMMNPNLVSDLWTLEIAN